MASAGLVGMEKTSPHDATMQGVSVDTRENDAASLNCHLYVIRLCILLFCMIDYRPLEILFDCCFDLIQAAERTFRRGKSRAYVPA